MKYVGSMMGTQDREREHGVHWAPGCSKREVILELRLTDDGGVTQEMGKGAALGTWALQAGSVRPHPASPLTCFGHFSKLFDLLKPPFLDHKTGLTHCAPGGVVVRTPRSGSRVAHRIASDHCTHSAVPPWGRGHCVPAAWEGHAWREAGEGGGASDLPLQLTPCGR